MDGGCHAIVSQLIAESFFTDLGKDEWVCRELSLGVNIDTAQENRTIGERVPTLPIFSDLLVGRDPIEGLGRRRWEQVE